MFQWARKLIGLDRPEGRGPTVVFDRGDTIKARYDNAQTAEDNYRQWWAADFWSAKSANSFQVRRTLRIRSRYEVANNPYLFGITNNNADDLIGTGPTLKLTTPDAAYNREVERAWSEWYAEVELTDKLRTCKLARTVDGEGFLVFKTVNDLECPVKLYPCDLEADQVSTPAPKNIEQLWVDGLVLHPVTGRPAAYTVLRHHPGDFWFPDLNPLSYDTISARHVVHWFPKFRPGQVRGIPVFTSSLDLAAELRAYRRAVLGAAEIAADYAAVLKQDREIGAVDTSDDTPKPFDRARIDRKMMTVLPPGMSMDQFDAKQPTTSYESFQEKCISEIVRPLNYPVNRALGTSQKFNFSSAKLDHIDYYNSLDVERADCERVALNPMFREFYREGTKARWFKMWQDNAIPPHTWHWPGHPSIDPQSDADTDHSRLSNGTLTWQQFWGRRGYDWDEIQAQQAREQEAIKKRGLEFGDPPSKTITEKDEEGNPKPKRANAAGVPVAA